MAWPPAQRIHAIEQMAQGASCKKEGTSSCKVATCETTGYEPKVTRPGMELSRWREASVQRRAAQALAGETAGAQLQQLVDDAAVAGACGANAVSTVPGSIGMVPGVSGGDLLAGLQPIGPPMSFSPGDFLEPVRGVITEGEKNLEVKGENPEVKRVVVSEPSSDALKNDGADGNASGSPQNGNGKGHGGHVATGKGNGGTQQVTQGSRVRQMKNEPGQPSGLDRNVVGENPPQMWVTGNVVGKNEIPKNVGQHGSEKHVVHGQGVEGSMPSGLGVQSQVNPFWSPECKREALREAYGPGYDSRDPSQLGFSAGIQDASQLGYLALGFRSHCTQCQIPPHHKKGMLKWILLSSLGLGVCVKPKKSFGKVCCL